jgi:hypothetical protein
MATQPARAFPCALSLAALVLVGTPLNSRSEPPAAHAATVDAPAKPAPVRPQSAAAKKAQQEERLGSETIAAAKHAVRDLLKDPDSAKFKAVHANHTEELGVVACGYVNAKNSFGSYTGFKRFVSAGKSVILEDIDDIDSAWSDGCLGEKQSKNGKLARIQDEADGMSGKNEKTVGNQDEAHGMSKPFDHEDNDKSPVKLATLTQHDIVAAMSALQPKVQACGNTFRIPGTATASISVARDGKVSSATVTGKFAGTPLGECVEAAAKSAEFPPCYPTTFPWPFSFIQR